MHAKGRVQTAQATVRVCRNEPRRAKTKKAPRVAHDASPGHFSLKGVSVFALAYEQVGLGWLFYATRVPGLNRLLDAAYDVFAENRTFWTRGGFSVDELAAVYQEKKALEDKKKVAECEGSCPTVL